MLAGALGLEDQLPAKSEQERAAHAALNALTTDGFGYFLEQSTRPQTIGYALLDSPVGLAAWLLDRDTDSYYKISRAFVEGASRQSHPGQHHRQHHAVMVDWHRCLGRPVVLGIWTGPGSGPWAGQAPPAVSVPVGFTTFPGEIWAAPRSWVEAVYPNLTYFNAVDRGGHFAAWEEPELFAAELRAAFRSLRPK